MSFWDTISTFAGRDLGKAAIGLGTSYYAGNRAEKATQQSAQAQREAADLAFERALPWSTGGLFGAAAFDPVTRTALQTLSPELKTEYDASVASAAAHRKQAEAMGVDPYAAGKKFYEQQKALYKPEQEKQLESLESRLVAQGMFGSTGGAGQMEALRTAQAQQDAAAQMSGLDTAQKLIDLQRARQLGDVSMAHTLGSLPSGYAATGQGIGQAMSPIASSAAQMQSSAAQGLSDVTSAKWGGLAKGVGSYLNPEPEIDYAKFAAQFK